MRVVGLSGWAQSGVSLALAFPGIEIWDYGAFAQTDDALRAIPQADVLIGWSLGGQLAARAVAMGHVQPKALVLIGAPYAWMRNTEYPEGTAAEEVAAHLAAFEADAAGFHARFQALLTVADTAPRTVRKVAIPMPEGAWAHWLRELANFSAHNIDFSKFPRTLLAHGEGDAVVHPASARSYAARIPHAELRLFSGVGHVPHAHPDIVREISAWVARHG